MKEIRGADIRCLERPEKISTGLTECKIEMIIFCHRQGEGREACRVFMSLISAPLFVCCCYNIIIQYNAF